jgi:hypothetical protein
MRNPGNRVQEGSIVRGDGNSSIKPGRALEGGSTMAANHARTPATAWNDEQSELIGVLPREVGVLLLVAGVGGILLPGPVGSPFLLLGAVTLWPRVFTRLEICFQKQFPRMHRTGTRQIKRFLADIDRRYPMPD